MTIVFPGTIWLGVLMLLWSGIIGAWGWLPFIASGAQLVARENARKQNGYVAAKERKEPEYPCTDILDENHLN